MKLYSRIYCVTLLFLAGCSLQSTVSSQVLEPDSQIISLLDSGKYHEAMRLLSTEMKAWAEYTKLTADTKEGAAGFLYSTTMGRVAGAGDVDWGKILDDPDIPYNYKIELISEILEARLGKGAAWSPWHADVVIIPRKQTLESWEDVNQLLKQVVSEQGH